MDETTRVRMERLLVEHKHREELKRNQAAASADMAQQFADSFWAKVDEEISLSLAELAGHLRKAGMEVEVTNNRQTPAGSSEPTLGISFNKQGFKDGVGADVRFYARKGHVESFLAYPVGKVETDSTNLHNFNAALVEKIVVKALERYLTE